jgi:hypothetical protein
VVIYWLLGKDYIHSLERDNHRVGRKFFR